MRKSLPLVVLVALLAAGCSRVPMLPGITAYKVDIQQGNYITQDMVAKLKPGMTRSQVRFILGTPLVTDPFHADRWDYVYTMQKKGETTAYRRMVLIFEDDKLARIEGDVVPAKGEASSAAADKKAAPSPPPTGGVPAAPAPSVDTKPAGGQATGGGAAPQAH